MNPLEIHIVGHDDIYLAFLSLSRLWNHRCHIPWSPVISRNYYAYLRKVGGKKY